MENNKIYFKTFYFQKYKNYFNDKLFVNYI